MFDISFASFQLLVAPKRILQLLENVARLASCDSLLLAVLRIPMVIAAYPVPLDCLCKFGLRISNYGCVLTASLMVDLIASKGALVLVGRGIQGFKG